MNFISTSILRTALTSFAAGLLLTACATVPSGPRSDAPTASGPTTSRSGSPAAAGTTRATARQSAPAFPAAEPPPPDPESNIFFATGSDQLTPAGRRQLQLIAERLKGKGREDVTLIGHTDDTGSTEFNIALGQRRVETVASALQAMGVSARQIRRISYGSEASGPLSCTTARCRQSERRVEFRFSGED